MVPTTLAAVVEQFFDDAGLFPPAGLPMAQALEAHDRALNGSSARLVGPFLCPVARLAELDVSVASGAPRPPELGVIAYDDRTPWTRIYARRGLIQVEAPQTARLPLAARRVRRYLEVSGQANGVALDAALDVVARARARAKVRCGGATRDDVPTCDWLAAVLVGCAQRDVKLKATGGLDQPFRQVAAGGPRHGFVNLLAGAAAAHTGSAVATVSEILAIGDDEADGLVAQASRGRELLASVGVWSVDRVASDLAERGLL
jgi:hypothetical protein